MTKKTFLALMCFMSILIFASTVHAQGSKKTLTLPNGEVVINLNGEWDVRMENYGENSWAGSYPQLVKVKQTGSSFVGVRMMDDPYNKKGAEQVRGELDKNGFKKVQMVSVQGEIDANGTISEDGNKLVIDNGVRARATYTRK